MLRENGQKLRMYQREGVERMKEMPHVLNFSEMRTGKTIVTIADIEEENLKPCLLIVPGSIKSQWMDEIEKWSDSKPYYANSVDDILEDYFDWTIPMEDKSYYIIHHEAMAFIDGYDLLRESMFTIHWGAVVIDESHFFRNPYAARTKAMMTLHANKFYFLTGTPIVNTSLDIFPALRKVGLVDNPDEFEREYTFGINDERYGYKALGNRSKNKLLSLMAPMYIRWLWSDVSDEIPEVSNYPLKLEMAEDQRQIYDGFVEELCITLEGGFEISASNKLALITRLKQLSLDPKILGIPSESAKSDQVHTLMADTPGEKWIVFSFSEQFLSLLRKKLPGCAYYTGTNRMTRDEELKRFRDDPGCTSCLMTVQSGGVGLNLGYCDNVVLVDPWWNRPTVDQALARILTPDKTRRISIYELECANSVDQYLKEVTKAKMDLSDEIVVSEELIKKVFKEHRGYDLVYKKKRKKSRR